MFENIYLTQKARGRGEKISGTKNARDTENKHQSGRGASSHARDNALGCRRMTRPTGGAGAGRTGLRKDALCSPQAGYFKDMSRTKIKGRKSDPTSTASVRTAVAVAELTDTTDFKSKRYRR